MLDTSALIGPQPAHAQFVLDALHLRGIALDTSDTGTGKTYSAAWIAKQMNRPIVVICPIKARINWKTTLAKFGLVADVIINYEKLCRGNTPHLRYNINQFHRDDRWWESKGIKVKFHPSSLVIVDEAHRCAGHTSLNSELLLALSNQNYLTLLMSASMATSVLEMKAIGYATGLHHGENFMDWCREHGATFNQYGTLSWDEQDRERAQIGLNRIHEELCQTRKIAHRMRKEEFGDLFPDNRVIAEIFDAGGNTRAIQSAYDTMQHELAMLDRRAQNYSQHHFAIMMKARRKIELLKVPIMVEWIMDTFRESCSPVLFANFVDTIAAVKARLERHPEYKGLIAEVVGGQTERVRAREVDDFQNNRKRIMLANAEAGNDCLSFHDLHGTFRRQSLLNPSWRAKVIKQCLGRIPRAEGKSYCLQKFLYANVPVEQRMAYRLEARLDNLAMLNDGDVSEDFKL
jgi:hypothetical protein